MTDRELMQQALEALERGETKLRYEAITALRAAIEEEEFWVQTGKKAWQEPRQWQGLTDDEIKEIIGPWGETPIKGYTRKLFDQIEAKLKEKNA